MQDREEAIRDIEMTEEFLRAKHELWYADLLSEALTWLKEQEEAVEPHFRCPTVYMNGTGKIEIMCGNCGISIPLGKPNYCPWCGKAVKWNA